MFPGASPEAAPALIWGAAMDDGGQVHLGSGNSAEVITLDRKGATAEGVEMNELGVRAMASAPGGELYFGTFPNGDVYRMLPGKDPELWAEIEERYIWSMAIDSSRRLMVGTGERGVVYGISAKGQKEVLLDTDQSHITALALDAGGRLLAGTDPDGLLYRVGEGGRAELLLDTDLREVPAVAVGPDGVIYAAAAGQEAPPAPRKGAEKSEMMIEVTPAPDGSILEDPDEMPRKITIDLADLLPAAPRGEEGTAGRVYRIEPGRPPLLAWKSDTERVYSLLAARDGSLLFGTGGPGSGRIYRLDAAGEATVLHELREPQVTALVGSPDGRVFACTSNPGRVYVLDPTPLTSGSYISEVYDSGRTAQWGSIAWDADVPAGSRVEVATRSGNRPVPDATWSAWTPAYASATGSTIASPPARYLQWRAELSRIKTDVSPALNRVRVTLLPQNVAPTIRGVAVLAPGEKAPAPPAGARGPEAATPADPPRGTRWVVWEAVDPDGDSLSVTLRARREGSAGEPRTLATGAAAPYALNPEGMEEGAWLLTVEADDAPSNGPQRALKARPQSDRFVVDRTAPRLEPRKPSQDPSAGHALLEMLAIDAMSAIARAEYALGGDDSGPWLPLPCRDGICDTPAESFLLDLPQTAAQGKVRLRVVDTAGNATVYDATAAFSR
jgi:hypothetical protein